MTRIFTIVLSVLFVAYPVLIYFGITTFSPAIVSAFVLMLLGVRLAVTWKISAAKIRPLLPLTLAAAVPATVSLVFNNEHALLLVPALVNAVLLSLFATSMVRGPTMIERFAALEEPEITPRISAYCRKVNVIWCVFFALNGLVALYTVFFMSKEYWALYNGLISYLLLGSLILGERIYRRQVKQKNRES
ncbi:MAG: septation protein IspZ [Deltaproteobacteria bacterium]|nr:septation protein IspZ [Deltaproteobacteria bacterium]MBN2673285.1 septation protein IspZ [Deltaproteobacteria bacterium]